LEEEKKRKKKEKQEKIKNYYDSEIYKIDYRRIEQQNKHFKEIKQKLEIYIKGLEECIENNKKIIDNYSLDPTKKENYKSLLKTSSSTEDIYEDKLQEFESYINEIKDIYKQGIKELKDNYLNDFNKKYKKYSLLNDEKYVGFRNDSLLYLNELNEVQFKEICRIDFKKMNELELKIKDNINIDVLSKATFHNIAFLGLLGRIKDINILSKLPFKSLKSLSLADNDFYNTNIDFFKNVPFCGLNRLILSNNNIHNILGLSKNPFKELT
jgi:hypothetical protein